MRDLLSDELSVDIGSSYLDDVDRNLLADLLFEIDSDLLDSGALLSDNDTGLSAVDVDLYLLTAVSVAESFDLDLGNACIYALIVLILGTSVKSLHHILADVVVLNKCVAESALICKPAGIPILYHTDSQSVRINFLAHNKPPLSAYSFSLRTTVTCDVLFRIL